MHISGESRGIGWCGVRIGLAGLVVAALPLISFAAEAEKEHTPGIVNLDFTLLLQAINFSILAFVLYRFLFKPLTAFMDKRAEGIRQSLEEAKRARDEVVRARGEYEESLKAARQEAVALRQRMDRGVSRRSEIEQEVRRAKTALRQEAVTLSLAAAERLLERSLTDEDHRRIAEQTIQELGRTS
jgi:F-type H+-transporting ATPase subunit b